MTSEDRDVAEAIERSMNPQSHRTSQHDEPVRQTRAHLPRDAITANVDEDADLAAALARSMEEQNARGQVYDPSQNDREHHASARTIPNRGPNVIPEQDSQSNRARETTRVQNEQSDGNDAAQAVHPNSSPAHDQSSSDDSEDGACTSCFASDDIRDWCGSGNSLYHRQVKYHFVSKLQQHTMCRDCFKKYLKSNR